MHFLKLPMRIVGYIVRLRGDFDRLDGYQCKSMCLPDKGVTGASSDVGVEACAEETVEMVRFGMCRCLR